MINKIREFLDPIIIDNKYIFLDFWAVPHFFLGIIIFAFLLKFFRNLKLSTKFGVLFVLILLWEILEFIGYKFMNSTLSFFGMADLFWDLVIGMLGGILFYYFNKKFEVIKE